MSSEVGVREGSDGGRKTLWLKLHYRTDLAQCTHQCDETQGNNEHSCTFVSLCFVALVSTFPQICSILSTSTAALHSFLKLLCHNHTIPRDGHRMHFLPAIFLLYFTLFSSLPPPSPPQLTLFGGGDGGGGGGAAVGMGGGLTQWC